MSTHVYTLVCAHVHPHVYTHVSTQTLKLIQSVPTVPSAYPLSENTCGAVT